MLADDAYRDRVLGSTSPGRVDRHHGRSRASCSTGAFSYSGRSRRRSSSEPSSSSSLRTKKRRFRDRSPAGEALADVDRRRTADPRSCRRGAARRRTGPKATTVFGSKARQRGARDLVPAAGRRSRSHAASRGTGRARRAPRRRTTGSRGKRRGDEAQDGDGAALELVVAVDPPPAGAGPSASIELPDGIGLSSRSFVRATSRSPSEGS